MPVGYTVEVKRVADAVRRSDRHYTYGDYRTWSDDERWELIDGIEGYAYQARAS
jgi:hypothetical protein